MKKNITKKQLLKRIEKLEASLGIKGEDEMLTAGKCAEPEYVYPLYKEYIADDNDKGMIVKFYSLTASIVAKETRFSTKVGVIGKTLPHNDTSIWKDAFKAKGYYDLYI